MSAGNHYDDGYDEDDGGDCDDGDACGDDHSEAKADGVCVPTIQGTYTSFSCRPDMKASLNMRKGFRSFWLLPDVKATDDMNI